MIRLDTKERQKSDRNLRALGRRVVCLMILVVSVSACTQVPHENAQVKNLKLTLLPSGAKILSGSLHNPTADIIDGALIQVSLFDDQNNLLSSITVAVETIEPGGDRRFREPLDTDLDVKRARVKKVVTL